MIRELAEPNSFASQSVQELLLLVGGPIRALLPELYRLWEGLIDFKGTARSVLPDSTAAAAVEVGIIHCLR